MSDVSASQFPMGSARATFVATVGRKVAGIRALVPKLSQSDAPFARNELKLRLLDLRTGAGKMHASALEETLSDLCAELESVLAAPQIAPSAITELDHRLAELPRLAWGKLDANQPAEESCLQALVLGPSELGIPLGTHLGTRGFYNVEVEAPTRAALAKAIALCPDVLVLDADGLTCTELAEELVSHPHTESIPLIVVGTFDEPAAESAYVALGVARTLKKPLAADAFRRAVDACVGLIEPNRVESGDYGSPTLPMLADRLAREVYHALNDVAGERDRHVEIPLGQGSDVTAALWGAIARVQEIVAARTGARFLTRGPAGSIALAAAIEADAPLAAERLRGQRGNTSAVDLHNRKVLVVDDDPAVVWFLADILKDAGCTVLEATSGAESLAMAERELPELILADIVMPGLDGVLLSRALKRDVVLRDVPVCLLSWKEDLLTRVRELGAQAAGYLRKETDALSVVARVKEALRPRARIEERLLNDGEIRGRLDGFTVGSLVAMANKTRPNARISLRDGRYLHELELRAGVPVKAVRVDADGHVLRGAAALLALAGVVAGRFTVASSNGESESEFDGRTFGELLQEEFAARRLLTKNYAAVSLAELSEVTLDQARAKDFARDCTPHSASLIHALCNGISLSDLASTTSDDDQLAELVSVLIARGIVRGIADRQGRDLALREVAALTAPSWRAGREETPAFGGELQPATAPNGEHTSVQGAPVSPSAFARTQVDNTLYVAASTAPVTSAATPQTSQAIANSALTPSVVLEDMSLSIQVDMEATPGGVSRSALPSDAPLALEQLGAQGDAVKQADWKLPIKKSKVGRIAAVAGVIGIAAALGFAAVQRSGNAASPTAGAGGTSVHSATSLEIVDGETRPDQGILVVTQAAAGPLRVDGVVRGDSTALRVPLVAGKHTVSREGGHSVAAVDVTAGKVTLFELKRDE